MADAEHLEILNRGVVPWNDWRRENPQLRPDLSRTRLNKVDLNEVNLREADLREVYLLRVKLSGADLSQADLFRAVLTGSDLFHANLSGAHLLGAFLREADLRGANLSGAGLSSVDFFQANLSRALLREADLFYANLSGANLSGTTIDHAVMGGTILNDIDLGEVQGLDSVRHQGPSDIGIGTIYKSRGKIPEVFLRGCGVPDNFIEYITALVGKSFDFHSCFISHSSKDKRFCDRLYTDLQENGVRTWYFPEDATWGKSVWGEIDESIRIYDKLVVICSKNSLQSVPVRREIERSLQREDREGKHVLFPVSIDDYIFDEWEHERKADVLSKVVGDFKGWNRSAKKYEAAFERLLKALQSG